MKQEIDHIVRDSFKMRDFPFEEKHWRQIREKMILRNRKRILFFSLSLLTIVSVFMCLHFSNAASEIKCFSKRSGNAVLVQEVLGNELCKNESREQTDFQNDNKEISQVFGFRQISNGSNGRHSSSVVKVSKEEISTENDYTTISSPNVPKHNYSTRIENENRSCRSGGFQSKLFKLNLPIFTKGSMIDLNRNLSFGKMKPVNIDNIFLEKYLPLNLKNEVIKKMVLRSHYLSAYIGGQQSRIQLANNSNKLENTDGEKGSDPDNIGLNIGVECGVQFKPWFATSVGINYYESTFEYQLPVENELVELVVDDSYWETENTDVWIYTDSVSTGLVWIYTDSSEVIDSSYIIQMDTNNIALATQEIALIRMKRIGIPITVSFEMNRNKWIYGIKLGGSIDYLIYTKITANIVHEGYENINGIHYSTDSFSRFGYSLHVGPYLNYQLQRNLYLGLRSNLRRSTIPSFHVKYAGVNLYDFSLSMGITYRF